MNFKGIIYICKNLINNKVYVGQTITKLQYRINVHKNFAFKYKYKTKFYRAIRKYGWDNFEWKEICTCITNLNDLNELEIFFINEFKSFGKNGYNMTYGGNGRGHWKEETKRKVALIVSKRYENKDFLEKSRIIQKNSWNNAEIRQKRIDGMKGLKKTPDHLLKMRLGRKIRTRVKCIETDQIFESIRHAASEMLLRPASIAKHLQRKQEKVKGFTFIKI